MTIDIKKIQIVGSICVIIGGMIGSFFYALTDNYIYIVAGVILGSAFGYMLSILINKKINLKKVMSIQNVLIFALAISSFFIAGASIVVYILKNNIVGILGALFFGICGIILLVVRTEGRS